MLTALTADRILTPDEEIERGTVIIEEGRITEVRPGVRPPPSAGVTELGDVTLVPGFIDLHVHGGGGISLAAGDAEQLRDYARWVAHRGVTSFLASIVADTAEAAEGALRAVAEAAGPVPGGANLAGAHLEGPFVNPARRGALPESWPQPPDLPLLRRFLNAAGGQLRLLTIAPELPGARDLQADALRAGCVVAVGHSEATYDEAREAFAAGAKHLTHAFNAMRPLHHREPGLLGAAIEDEEVTVELIADGVHVHPAAVALVLRAKGASGVALVTDGAPPAGLARGDFDLGGRRATLSGERVTLPDGTLAGGGATMDGIVRGIVDRRLASLPDALLMASTVPARALGAERRKGRIAAGYDADLVAIDGGRRVVMTWVGGQRVQSS